MTIHYDTYRRYSWLRTRWLNVYLHVYYCNTELPYHDHPWWNVTIRLWGSFAESLISNYMSLDRGKETTHVSPRFVFRRATTAHKMRKLTTDRLVTIFVTGHEWNVIRRAV